MSPCSLFFKIVLTTLSGYGIGEKSVKQGVCRLWLARRQKEIR